MMKKMVSGIVSAWMLVAVPVFPIPFQFAMAQQPGNGTAQQLLEQAESKQEYTFLLFHRQMDRATQGMEQFLRSQLDAAPVNSQVVLVPIMAPENRELVSQFGAARAPMPLAIAVGPNGAVTGAFPQRLTKEEFLTSFVSATALRCVKALQDNHLVFVQIGGTGNAASGTVVEGFRKDPLYQSRLSVLSVSATDSTEQVFLRDFELSQQDRTQGAIVVIAPPGVLVGKFPLSASKSQIATAIADAGKCCDDPNCKHHRNAESHPQKVR